jgi:hypothetical protein
MLRAFVLAAAACGSVTSPTQPDASGDPTGDATPDGVAPTVTSVSPPDGAAGVAADAVIVIAFSEPMAAASVEAAWTSAALPAAAVALSWNAAGDTLTITPSAPLELAEGTGLDPSTVVPRAYEIGLAATATDRSGVALAAPLTVGFTTQRRMTVDLAPIGSLTRTMRGDGLVLGDTAVTLTVGDTTGNLQYKTFASFTLPELPAGASLETATLGAAQNSVVNNAYLLGTLDALHVNTATIDAAAFGAAPLAAIGVLSATATTGRKTIDVKAAVADDLAQRVARGGRTQYRLQFPTATNSDATADEARFSRSGFGLTLTYLVD